MGVHIIDYVASFVILLGLLTFTITSTTGTLDNLFIYHQNIELNSVATNLLNNLLGSTGAPSDWAQSTADPTSIGLAWGIGEGNNVNPFVPMRMMDVTVETMYGGVAYNDLSITNLNEWPGANLYFRADDSVEYVQAAQLLNSVEDFNWRVAYTPAYNVEIATSMPAIIPWYAGWGYRMELTINHTKFSTTMNDYQLLVSVTQPTLQANARSDGGDILFTTSDKLTKIPHELDYFDPVTGKVTAWVKIPVISDTADTVIYMYYGNPAAPNQASPAQVWSGYKSVFHMEDLPDSSHIRDSTTSGLVGSKSGDHEPAEIINGAVSYAQGFDGSNDFVSLSQANLSGNIEVFEMWLKSTRSSTLQTIISNGVKNTTSGFIDISRLPQTDASSGDDLLIDYAVNGGWVQKAASAGIDLTCLQPFKNKMYAGASDGDFYVWNDVNAWVALPSLPSPEKFASLAVYNNKLYAGTNGGAKLYEWDEGYSSWILKAPTLRILSLVLNPSDGKIYGGTDDGRLLRWNTATSHWDTVAPTLGSENSINCLVIYSSDLYGGTSPGGKLYRWNSAGAGSWVLVASPPVSNPFTDVTSIVGFNGKLFAGTNPGGYLVSWESGSYWVLEKTTGESTITALSSRQGYLETYSYAIGSSVGSWAPINNARVSDNQYLSHTVEVNNNAGSLVSGTWTNPTYAYTSDGQYARTSTNGAQEVYSGYGTFSAAETVSKVYIGIRGYASNSGQSIRLSVYDGSTWYTVSPDFSLPTSNPSLPTYIDVTSLTTWTIAKLNALQTRVQFIKSGGGTRTAYLDWLPVLVQYNPSPQVLSSFNAVPSGTGISKVEVGIEGYMSNASGDEQLSVSVSADNGVSWSPAQSITLPKPADTNTVTYLDFTSYTSWTNTLLDNNHLKVRIIEVYTGSTASIQYLDYVCVRVTSGVELYASTSPHTYVWKFLGGSWDKIIDTQYGTESAITSTVQLGSTLYGCTYPSGILVKQGTGGSSNTWVLAAAAPAPQKITTLITDGTNIFGGSSPSGLLYKSVGGAWSPVVTNQYGGETAILSLAFDSSGTRVEAGSDKSGLLLSAGKAAVGGSWTKDADITLSSGETEIRSMTVYNGKLYLGTSPHGLLYEWDGSNALVQRAPQFPGQTRINSMAVLNGRLYGGTSTGSLLEWTTGDAAWDQSSAPFGTESVNSIVSYNNKIYGSTSPGGRLLEWSVGTSAWVGKTYILGSETSVSILVVYNGKLYGGTSPGGMLYEWDGATKWVRMASTQNGQTNIPCIAVYNDKLYGGTSGGGYLFEFSDVGERIIPNFFTGSEGLWVQVDLEIDYTNDLITVYRNGTLLPVTLSTPNIVNPLKTPKYLGGFIVSGISYNPYSGYIDELRIDGVSLDDGLVGQNFDNQLNPEPYTSLGDEESIFFKVNVRVSGEDGSISGATVSGTLVFCKSGATTPSYGVLYSEPEVTDSKGEAEIEFRGYTSDNPAYFILVRAEHFGISGVDYYVSDSSLTEDPFGVFVTDYDDGELTITHKGDFDAAYPDPTPVEYNATFLLPIGGDYYRSVYLDSAGTLSLASPRVVQLQDTKESSGVLLVFYKTSTGVYGVSYTPWGVSALGLETTFGAPVKDATNVITKTKVVNIGAFTYEVKVEIWTTQR